MEEKIEVFIVFAPEDHMLLTELENHLQPAVLEGLISIWHERKMVGGMEREREINKYLSTASIILLLISANFMASDTCYKLGKQAVEKNKQGQEPVQAIPVLLQEVDWEYSIFGKLTPLPDNGKPVASWGNRNTAYREVVRGIRQVVAELYRPPESNIASPVLAGSKPNKEPSVTQDSENKAFDVFLSYNNKDRAEVKEIARQLKERGMKPWLDEWEIRPGLSWQDALEKQIDQIHAAAVFVGKEGIGPWQHMEMNAYLRKFVRRGSPVIPVLLKDAQKEPPLPVFLQEMHYVDFRTPNQEFDPIDQMIWGITGQKSESAHSPANSQGVTPPSSPAVHATAPMANVSVGSLSFQKKTELVSKLLACPTMQDRHSRDVVVQQLPGQISRSISRHSVDTVDVTNIVSTCINFRDGLQTLVDIVAFFEGDALPMQQLRNFMQNL